MRLLSLVLGGLLVLLGSGFLLFVGALGGLETTKRVWAEPTATVEAMHRTDTGLLEVRVHRERPADQVLAHCTLTCDPDAGRVWASSHVGWLGSPLTWFAGGAIVVGAVLAGFGLRGVRRR